MKHREAYRQPRVAITGGGTGGHVFPAIAIANALEPVIERSNILFIGANGKMEMERVPAAGYRIEGLPITGLQGGVNAANLMLPFRIAASLFRALRILRDFRPDVVVGVGGFASAPSLVAARWMRIPYLIQEQNSIPGKVNMRLGRHARIICTAFSGMGRFFPKSRVILTGNPVRSSIRESAGLKAEGCEFYHFDPAKPVLLVIGGSQGARSLNRSLAGCIGALAGQGIQVIWQTGKGFAEEALRKVQTYGLQGVVVSPFIERMELAYGAASLVVSRAGALALAEISLARLPSILVPFPHAAGDHQTFNARAMEAGEAAVTINDHDLDAKLLTTIRELIADSEKLRAMGANTSKTAFPDADRHIAQLVLEVAGHGAVQPDAPETRLDEIRRVYFLGAGGIGMSGLARWFMLMGKRVHGYDRTSTPLTQELEREGMQIHYEDRPDMIPEDTDLVVITPAIPKSLAERQMVEKSAIPMLKRAEVLGMISRRLTTIAVAGTHGKTSTTALITHLLKDAGIPVTGFIGGITKNYHNNFVFTPGSRFMVVEADEFDRSFLHLKPSFSVITSTDADHLDIYGNHENLIDAFISFGNLNGPTGPLLVHTRVVSEFGKPVLHYSAEQSDAPFRAEQIRDEGTYALFDLVLEGVVLKDVRLGIPGRHNIENAVAASAAALWAGVTHEQLRKGLESYRGVCRRFDIRINRDDMVYIDDYAHHPRELSACIGAVKKIYPGKKITGIFQPHLFTRTRDFADGFAESLEMLDRIILLEIYPAREEPIPGINSMMLLEKIRHNDKMLLSKDALIRQLPGFHPEVLLTLGAGDIDTLVPRIEELFSKTSVR